MTPEDFKAWRKARGFNQQEAADALGLSKGTIVNYESGVRRDTGEKVIIPETVQAAMRNLAALQHLDDHLERERKQLAWLVALGGKGLTERTIEQPELHDVTEREVERQKRRISDLEILRASLADKKPT